MNALQLPGPVIPWVETVAALALAMVGVILGRKCARLPGLWWTAGYFLPLALVLLLGLPSWLPQFYFIPPISWLTAGRTEYALAGVVTSWLLTTPLSRLPRVETRRLVMVFMGLVVLGSSVAAFLGPALVRKQLLTMMTQVDSQGVCRQGNNYNCGPAAAVTTLRRLGIQADEGELAVAAHTSPLTGTAPDVLANALHRHYGSRGVSAEYRFFRTLHELRQAGEVLAIIKFSLLVDHYVAVMEIDDHSVTVGDPLLGKVTCSHAEFTKKWRHCGVVVKRGRNHPQGMIRIGPTPFAKTLRLPDEAGGGKRVAVPRPSC